MWVRSSLCLLFAAACVLPTSAPDSGSTTSAATTASRLAESSTSGAGVTAPPTGTQANVTSAAGDPHLTQTPGGTSAVSTQTTPGSGAPARTTASAVTTHPQATPGGTSSDSPTGSGEQGILSTTSSVSVASTAALTTLPGAAQTTPSTATANTTGATAPPGGTTGAATATGTPAPAVRQLSFSLDQTFIPQLSDNTSPEFQGLARNISTELNKVYSAKFNETFLGSVVTHLRNGSVVADVELQFRSQASAPSPQEVKVTLQGAVQSGSFPLPVNTSTIQAQEASTPGVTSIPSTTTGAHHITTATPSANATSGPVAVTTAELSTNITTITAAPKATTLYLNTTLPNADTLTSSPNTTVINMTTVTSSPNTAVTNTTTVTNHPNTSLINMTTLTTLPNMTEFNMTTVTTYPNTTNSNTTTITTFPNVTEFNMTTVTTFPNTTKFNTTVTTLPNVTVTTFPNTTNFNTTTVTTFSNTTNFNTTTVTTFPNVTEFNMTTVTIFPNTTKFNTTVTTFPNVTVTTFPNTTNFNTTTVTTFPNVTEFNMTTVTAFPNTTNFNTTTVTTFPNVTEFNMTTVTTFPNTTKFNTTVTTFPNTTNFNTTTVTTFSNTTKFNTTTVTTFTNVTVTTFPNTTKFNTTTVTTFPNVTEFNMTTVTTFPNKFNMTTVTTFPNTTINATQTTVQTITPAMNGTSVTTTSSTTSPDPTSVPFGLRLLQNFIPEYQNTSSSQYKALVGEICRTLDSTLRRLFRGFQSCGRISLSSGSVLVDGQLQFDSASSTPSSSDTVRALKSATTSGNLGSIPVDTESLRSGNVSLSTLSPLEVKVQLLIAEPYISQSLPYASLSNWLGGVLSKYYGTLGNNYFAVLSNSSNWIDTTITLIFNTTHLESSSTLTQDILASSSPLRYLKNTLRVNGQPASIDTFSYSMRITNLEFQEALSIRSSAEFALKSTQISNSISQLYKDRRGFVDTYVMNMSKGSVIANTLVAFQAGQITSPVVTYILRSGLPQLDLDGLKVDASSIKDQVTPLPLTSRPFPGFAVAIIVMCSLAIILIPVAIIVMRKTGLWKKVVKAFSLGAPQEYNVGILHHGSEAMGDDIGLRNLGYN